MFRLFPASLPKWLTRKPELIFIRSTDRASFYYRPRTGVVIGATCIIGNNVKLYQGVTLGAKSFPLDENGNPIKGIARHPILEDDVIVYSNATILGRITIVKVQQLVVTFG